MANKIHPNTLDHHSNHRPESSSGCDRCDDMISSSSQQETTTFTVWMKSLVCHSNGCTVFNSHGDIVYRVENYDQKCSNEVHLMDLRGNVLFTLRRKTYALVFARWEGYRWSSSSLKPWFRVKRLLYCKLLLRDLLLARRRHQVSVGQDRLWIVRLGRQASSFRIVNRTSGDIIAEVHRKQSSCGISFGEDVLTLKVEPFVDHSLVVALVTVYGMIRHLL